MEWNKTLIRVNKAKLWVVTNGYIDYWEFLKEGRRHGFAQIDKKDFPQDKPKAPGSDETYDSFYALMDTLECAVKDDTAVNLVLEKRKVDGQFMDFLVKVEIAWQEN